MTEHRSTLACVVAAILLLIPCVYVGSYLLLMEPCTSYNVVYNIDGHPYVRLGTAATYNTDWEGAETFFTPAHYVDQRIRPQRWALREPTPLPADVDLQKLNVDELVVLLVDQAQAPIVDAIERRVKAEALTASPRPSSDLPPVSETSAR